ncbi:OmpA family protein [Sulfurimonas hydrogeniphila]|uniref:OmpA family protein n=1 Tax=Sulfurimonas hydrogeniphila TaxID=2509341 RepID=UPI00125F0429|nr:OmpA family protein [Sulfurimonas hydrogeniphila]
MKKRFLLPLLLAGTLIQASDYKYEISPMIGYDIAEGNLGIKDDGYFTGGVEVQFNTLESKISPEFSVFHSRGVDYKSGGDTQITRGAFNGVYTFEKTHTVIPFAKMGVGIENISDTNRNNETGMFLDAGAGVKIPFTQNWALKLEAIYMAKIASNNAGNADSNLVGLVGLTYSFGAQKAQTTPEVVTIVEEKVILIEKPEVDSDGDGIYDALDKCPNTPPNSTVDINGCKISLDDDHDGVENSLDKCPNTPVGTPVNVDGCPQTINLDIHFESNSYAVKQTSLAKIDAFANFLKKYKNYSAEIVGYTDSRGSEAYNKKLSQKRADEVKKLLVQKGVPASRLTTVGMGELNPIASNKTAEGRAQNRRIEANLTLN